MGKRNVSGERFFLIVNDRKVLFMDSKNNNNYHDQQNINNIQKMRAVLDTLPPFCRQFFRGITEYTSARTRLAYAYDIRTFFEYLHDRNSYCGSETVQSDFLSKYRPELNSFRKLKR